MKFYGFFSTIFFYLTLPIFYLERVLHKKSFGWKEKFGNVNKSFMNEKVIMLHACSVGEVNAIVNLGYEIKKNFPEYKLVVTTGTKTGQDLAQKKFDNVADLVTYFPFDIPSAVNKFLDAINPSVVTIVETEIWPYFAYSCKSRNIPLFIINGRISDSTYKKYKTASLFFKQVFKNFEAIYVQSQGDKEKFQTVGMGSSHVEFMGNLKFDIETQNYREDLGQDGCKVLIAGSTHKGENEILLETYQKLKSNIPNLKLLIAPRHLERVQEIKNLVNNAGIKYGTRSQKAKFTDNDIIILDTLGELGKMYSACDVAFIGGSFVKKGGHNPLEAAIFYKPTVSGPSIHNFKDIYAILTTSNAGSVVQTPTELYEELFALLSDDKKREETGNNCKNVFEKQKGAMKFVQDRIREVLN